MNLKMTSAMMTMMFLLSALAGCTGSDEAVDLDDSDGGYDYASNVDNHRMLMGDVCDIKDLSGAYDWDGVVDIYENGEHAEKSDGSYRTCLLYTSPSPRDRTRSRMPSSA